MKNTKKSPETIRKYIMSKRGIALLAAAVIPMTMLLAGCGEKNKFRSPRSPAG